MQRIGEIWRQGFGGKMFVGCGGCLSILLFVALCSAAATAIGGGSPKTTPLAAAATPTVLRPTVAAVVAVAPTDVPPTNVPPTDTPAPTAVPAPTGVPTTPPEPTVAPTDVPTPAPPTVPGVGQRTEAAGVAVTVNTVKRKSALSSFQKAGDGNEYVLVDVLIENTASTEEPYNPFYFKVKDGTGVESTIEMNTAQGSLKSGTLPPGDKVKGSVAFKVTAGASGLVMTYEPLVILGGYKPIRISLDK